MFSINVQSGQAIIGTMQHDDRMQLKEIFSRGQGFFIPVDGGGKVHLQTGGRGEGGRSQAKVQPQPRV
jgi:hypothetical protein